MSRPRDDNDEDDPPAAAKRVRTATERDRGGMSGAAFTQFLRSIARGPANDISDDILAIIIKKISATSLAEVSSFAAVSREWRQGAGLALGGLKRVEVPIASDRLVKELGTGSFRELEWLLIGARSLGQMSSWRSGSLPALRGIRLSNAYPSVEEAMRNIVEVSLDSLARAATRLDSIMIPVTCYNLISESDMKDGADHAIMEHVTDYDEMGASYEQRDPRMQAPRTTNRKRFMSHFPSLVSASLEHRGPGVIDLDDLDLGLPLLRRLQYRCCQYTVDAEDDDVPFFTRVTSDVLPALSELRVNICSPRVNSTAMCMDGMTRRLLDGCFPRLAVFAVKESGQLMLEASSQLRPHSRFFLDALKQQLKELRPEIEVNYQVKDVRNGSNLHFLDDTGAVESDSDSHSDSVEHDYTEAESVEHDYTHADSVESDFEE
jgi:hypothetical protein